MVPQKSGGRRGAVLREAQSADELRKTIEAIAPNETPNAHEKAMAELQAAITDFREAYLYAEGEYRVHSRIAGQRGALDKLTKSLRSSITILEALPPEVIAALYRRIGSRAELIRELKNWANAAEKEHRNAIESNDRPDDNEPALLAFAVARTLRDTLSGKVAMTSDRGTTSAPRNGAAYARLVRATLEAAGMNPPDDLYPLLKVGKNLLAEFETK